jgi:CBS domain containing-hemolysin-like protein
MIARRFPAPADPSFTEDELHDIIETIEDEGLLEPDQQELLQSAFEFGDITARDILIPLEKVIMIDAQSTQDQIAAKIAAYKYSRFPVWDARRGRVTGILQVNRFLTARLTDTYTRLRALLIPIRSYRADMHIDDLMTLMNQHRGHMALIRGRERPGAGHRDDGGHPGRTGRRDLRRERPGGRARRGAVRGIPMLLTNIAVILLLILISAFFSADEIAFTSINARRMRRAAEDGDRRSALVMRIYDQFDDALSAILIGNNLVNIAASSVATVAAIAVAGEAGAGLASVIMTVVVVLFGEITPKILAKRNCDAFARQTAYPLRAVMLALRPAVKASLFFVERLARALGAGERLSPGMTEEELTAILETAEDEGVIDEDRTDLVQSALEFDDSNHRPGADAAHRHGGHRRGGPAGGHPARDHRIPVLAHPGLRGHHRQRHRHPARQPLPPGDGQEGGDRPEKAAHCRRWSSTRRSSWTTP